MGEKNAQNSFSVSVFSGCSRGSEGVWRVTACALIIRGRGRDDSSWITWSNAVKCTHKQQKCTYTHRKRERESDRRFASSTRLIVWQLWLINHSLFSSIHWINEEKKKKHEWSSPSFSVSTVSLIILSTIFYCKHPNMKKKYRNISFFLCEIIIGWF